MNITFLYPWYFLLLIPLFLVLIIIYKSNKNKHQFRFFWDLEKIYKNNTVYIKIYYFLIFLILLCFIFIFSNMVSQSEKEEIKKNGIDINIVLDVSYSMLASDLKPNRLEVSKDIISKFIKELKTDRVWLTVFAWKPFVSLPLNFAYKVTEKIISKISVDTINQKNFHMQWTAIWDALLLAWESFDKEDNREKVIILLTDWEANKWLNPTVASKYLSSNFKDKIKIYTIWIWWIGESYIELKNDFWWIDRLKVWWLDEVTLKEIARIWSWKYFRATNKNSLKNIFDSIAKLEKKEIDSKVFTINTEKNIIFIYILLFLFSVLVWVILRKNV